MGLRAEEPCLLLERSDELMEDVGRRRVGLVDFVMNRADRGDLGGFHGSYAEVDGVMSRDLAGRELRQRGLLGDDAGAIRN